MQGVASFQSLVTLETDKKVNIIYGLNGTGKSTLSNFLYEQSGSDYTNCSVDIGSDETILVYNQRFIQDNFFEADNLKGIFSLSKKNKDIEEKVKAAEAELITLEATVESEQKSIEEKKGEFSELKEKAHEKLFEIKRKYTGGDRVLEFCLKGLKRKEPLFMHVSGLYKPEIKPEKGIQLIKNEVESISSETAQKHDLLPIFSLEEHLIEKHEVFEQVIVGNSDSPISSLITELKNSDWVRKGLEFISENNGDQPSICPFCQEKTLTSHLVKQIENYFDKSYDDSVNMISNFIERYISGANKLLSLDSYKTNPFVDNHLSKLTLQHRNLEKSLNNNISAIKKKIGRAACRERVGLYV